MSRYSSLAEVKEVLEATIAGPNNPTGVTAVNMSGLLLDLSITGDRYYGYGIPLDVDAFWAAVIRNRKDES